LSKATWATFLAARTVAEELPAVHRQPLDVPAVELVERRRLAGGEAAAQLLVR
jgi:hypothetical protein